jgi:hypothetical protein
VIYGSFISNFPARRSRTSAHARAHREAARGEPELPQLACVSLHAVSRHTDVRIRDEGGFQPPTELQDWAHFNFEGTASCRWADRNGKFYERLYVATLFNDKKYDEYYVPWWARIGAQLYRPIAQQRLKHMYFDYMPEVHVARRFLKAV